MSALIKTATMQPVSIPGTGMCFLFASLTQLAHLYFSGPLLEEAIQKSNFLNTSNAKTNSYGAISDSLCQNNPIIESILKQPAYSKKTTRKETLASDLKQLIIHCYSQRRNPQIDTDFFTTTAGNRLFYAYVTAYRQLELRKKHELDTKLELGEYVEFISESLCDKAITLKETTPINSNARFFVSKEFYASHPDLATFIRILASSQEALAREETQNELKNILDKQIVQLFHHGEDRTTNLAEGESDYNHFEIRVHNNLKIQLIKQFDITTQTPTTTRPLTADSTGATAQSSDSLRLTGLARSNMSNSRKQLKSIIVTKIQEAFTAMTDIITLTNYRSCIKQIQTLQQILNLEIQELNKSKHLNTRLSAEDSEQIKTHIRQQITEKLSNHHTLVTQIKELESKFGQLSTLKQVLDYLVSICELAKIRLLECAGLRQQGLFSPMAVQLNLSQTYRPIKAAS